ncbi:cell division protein FtsX [Sphingomonas sp. CJ20]
MKLSPDPSATDRRLLDESGRTRAMAWIMAIMLFLTVLAAALGLGMAGATAQLDRQLAGRLTVQIVEPDPATRDRTAAAMVTALSRIPGVTRVAEADRARLAALLQPWLGDTGIDPDLPMPALIDVEMRGGDVALVEQVARRIAPAARVDRHAAWLSPVRGFLSTLSWLALGLVLLIAAATAAVVLLAARSGLDTHRATIEVLHMLGATDVQIARLFQRRIAFDTLAGGLLGTGAAIALASLLQARLGLLGSEMLNGIALQPRDWLLLPLLPLSFALLATGAARFAVLRALGRTL